MSLAAVGWREAQAASRDAAACSLPILGNCRAKPSAQGFLAARLAVSLAIPAAFLAEFLFV
jgi:hypothetical protein